MDLLTHVFLPLILLTAIGRLKAKYAPLVLLSILPDFDKLFFLGILHSVTTAPVFAALFYLERKIKHGYEISVISSYFFFSHLFLDFLDGFVPLLYPISKIGVGIVFPAKLLIGNSSVAVEDIFPQLVFSELKPSNCYDLFSGFGFASMIFFFLIIAFRRKG
ncbi:MAG: hypothetical protein DSO00_02325 [Archaeoglobi archaeon]|nr:MAG: hypothetical protein DSO00_02325 [Archaeoglobi archaeon]